MHKDVESALYLLSKIADYVAQTKVRLDKVPIMIEDAKAHIHASERRWSNDEVASKVRAIRDIIDEMGVVDEY